MEKKEGKSRKPVLTVQKSLKFQNWMYKALEEIAQKNMCTFTDVINDFLEKELNKRGYFRIEPTADDVIEMKEIKKGKSAKTASTEELLKTGTG